MSLDIIGFTSSLTDVPMLARLVRQGEGFGRFMGGEFVLSNSFDDCLIEFYDERDRDTVHNGVVGGRFINRYPLHNLALLAEHSEGFCLDPSFAPWQISGNDLRKVLRWANNLIAGDTDVSEVTIDSACSYEKLFFAPNSANQSDLYSLGRNGLMQTIGVEVDYCHPSILAISPINSRREVGRCEIRIPKDRAHIEALMGILQKALDDAESPREEETSVA